MAKYVVEIHGFDPTPESVDWIRQQTLPPSFQHHPVAIGGHDGEMIFELPQALGQCARGIDPNSIGFPMLECRRRLMPPPL
jgi:hypothetical protein